jgi:hypothetical protein
MINAHQIWNSGSESTSSSASFQGTQPKARLEAIAEKSENFLTPKVLTDSSSMPARQRIKIADKFVDAYLLDISPNLEAQHIRFRTCFAAKLQSKTSIRDVTEMHLCHRKAATSSTDIATTGFVISHASAEAAP